MAAVVHGIDHVYVPLTQPEAAFEAMTTTLGLPIAWPFVAYGHFASGGVNLGGLNLEVVADSGDAPGPASYSPARVRGIALRPVATSQLVAALDERGIDHSGPEVFPPGASEELGALWTNVVLGPLSERATTVFTCEYHIPAMSDYGSRQSALDQRGGGVLGLTGVREVVISATRPTEMAARWQQLLDPRPPADLHYWEFDHGPALRIVEGATDAVQELVITVRSLAGIARTGAELARVLQGLDIRFVEADSRIGTVRGEGR